MTWMKDPRRSSVVAFTLLLLCAGSCTHGFTEQTSVLATCWGFARVLTHFFNMWCVMALWNCEDATDFSRYRILFVALLNSGIIELWRETPDFPASPWVFAWAVELFATLPMCWMGYDPEKDSLDFFLLQARTALPIAAGVVYICGSLMWSLWDT